METMHIKLPETVNDRHYIILDGSPTLLEKGPPVKPSGPGALSLDI
jgi:hypothetical protein